MSSAGICLCFAGIALVPKNWGAGIAMSAAGICLQFGGMALVREKLERRHHHVCCRHLLMFCRHRVYKEKSGRRHRHFCCRHLLKLCRRGIYKQKWCAGPHSLWGLKKLKGKRYRGEGPSDKTAAYINSIVYETFSQTAGLQTYEFCCKHMFLPCEWPAWKWSCEKVAKHFFDFISSGQAVKHGCRQTEPGTLA